MKVAIIKSGSGSAWQSCVSITANLEQSYLSNSEVQSRAFHVDSVNIVSVIRDLRTFAPDHLAIVDHGLFPARFLAAWLDGAGEAARIPITLHCFGDFPLAAGDWKGIESRLEGIPVRFIGASEASSQLIAKLVREGSPSVSTVPFPIDSDQFFRDSLSGSRLLTKLGTPSGSFVIAYTGRFSLQKNTTLLVEAVLDFARTPSRPVTLLLAGGSDDIGADFLNIEFQDGFYRQHFHEALSLAAQCPNLRIVDLGNLPPDKLRAVYNAADVFLSLSMHHDEDFGMSPAEALCCGTPAILSGWGGFHSFADLPLSAAPGLPPIRLVALEREGESVGLRSEELYSALESAERSGPNPAERKRLADRATACLSIEAVGALITRIHREDTPPFSGFTELMARLVTLNRIPGRYLSGRFANPDYLKIYSSYLSPRTDVMISRGEKDV
jgi:glycosyltransferase involved in cell wall biosynthesis